MSEQPQHSVIVGNTDLTTVASARGPFATLLLSPGRQAVERAQIALDRFPVPAPFAQLILDVVPDETHASQVVIASRDGDVFVHKIDEPFRRDAVRYGSVPSLGAVLEASQMVSSHLVMTLDDDVFAITSFGIAGTDEINVFEARDPAIAHLKAVNPPFVALIGSSDRIQEMRSELGRAMPLLAVNGYPSDQIDSDLETISDTILVDATTRAAEDVTRALGMFRAARAAGHTVEGDATISAVESGLVEVVLVHDDDSTEPLNGIRVSDQVVASAIRLGVPVIMIPGVPIERGPRSGLGAILELDHSKTAAVTAATSDSASQSNELPLPNELSLSGDQPATGSEGSSQPAGVPG